MKKTEKQRKRERERKKQPKIDLGLFFFGNQINDQPDIWQWLSQKRVSKIEKLIIILLFYVEPSSNMAIPGIACGSPLMGEEEEEGESKAPLTKV